MKYLKSYNESIRHLLKPKSEDYVENKLKDLPNWEKFKTIIRYNIYSFSEISEMVNSLPIEEIRDLVNKYSDIYKYISEENITKLYSLITEIYNIIKNSPFWSIKNIRDYQAREYIIHSKLSNIMYGSYNAEFSIMLVNSSSKCRITITETNRGDSYIDFRGIFDKKQNRKEFNNIEEFFHILSTNNNFPEPLRKYFNMEYITKTDNTKKYYNDKHKLLYRDRKRLLSNDIIDESKLNESLKQNIDINNFLEEVGFRNTQKQNIIEWWDKNRPEFKIYYYSFKTNEPISGGCVGINEIAINKKMSTLIPYDILLFILIHETRHSDQHKEDKFNQKYFETVLNKDLDNFLKYYKELEKDANDYALNAMEQLGFNFSEPFQRHLRQNETAGKGVYKMMLKDIEEYQPKDFFDLIRKQIDD